MAPPYTNGSGSCTCVTCGNSHAAATTLFMLPIFGSFDDLPMLDPIEAPYRPPALHILREQTDRERASQRQARQRARGALGAVAGKRGREHAAALSMRAHALRRAA